MELGFISLGTIGTLMIINLACAGHQLHVTTTGPVVNGSLPPDTASVEVARQVTDASDVIFIMVPSTSQTEDVPFGENGRTRVSLKGRTIADMSSTSPVETKRFAHQVNGLDGDYPDALVSDGEIGVREGTLSTMVGGGETVFERVKPLFGLLGKDITLVGDNGDNQTCKAANQVIVALSIEAVSEALLFASKAGTDPIRVRQALTGGFASSRILEVHGEHMIKHTLNPGFKTMLYQKDLNPALQSVKTLALSLPNTATCQELFNTRTVNSGSQLDHSTLVQALELMANHKLAWHS